MWQLLKTTCYGPLAIHTICKYNLICATLYNFFVLVHNTGENTIFSFLFCFVVFLAIFDLQRTLIEKRNWKKSFSLKKKKKKEGRWSPVSSPLWWGAHTEAVWDAACLAGVTTDSKHQELSWPDRCPSRCVASGEEVRVTSWLTPPLSLWLTVAYFDPLSDE